MKLPVEKDAGYAPNAYLGAEKECIYCKSPRGQEHSPGCVCVKKTVVLDMTIRYVAEVPDLWTQEDIEFHFNDSTHCTSNVLDKIMDQSDDGCVCSKSKIVYVGDATQADHDKLGYVHET